MNEIKLILFDIDGTLVDETTHIIPQSTRDALKKLKQLGYILAISTGRGIQLVIDSDVAKIIEWDMYLCNNGVSAYDKNGKVIFEKYIEHNSIREAIEIGEKRGQPLLLLSDNYFLTKEVTKEVIQAHAYFNLGIPEIKKYEDENVIMAIAYDELGYDYHDYQVIQGIRAIPGQSTYADIVIDGYSKYEGIKFALKYFNVDSYMAFGDSRNDIEMIRNADIGIAMGNSNVELKKIAAYTTSKVLDDGIYKALLYYGIF